MSNLLTDTLYMSYCTLGRSQKFSLTPSVRIWGYRNFSAVGQIALTKVWMMKCWTDCIAQVVLFQWQSLLRSLRRSPQLAQIGWWYSRLQRQGRSLSPAILFWKDPSVKLYMCHPQVQPCCGFFQFLYCANLSQYYHLVWNAPDNDNVGAEYCDTLSVWLSDLSYRHRERCVLGAAGTGPSCALQSAWVRCSEKYGLQQPDSWTHTILSQTAGEAAQYRTGSDTHQHKTNITY